MKRTAVFFDRDNTLIQNDGFLGDPAQVVLMEGAAEAVARARGLGFATVTISNQSGVARGMFEEEDVERVNARMDELLAADNAQATFDRHEFCPFHPEGNIDVYRRESDRRKPAPGMILSAAQKLELDLKASWVIGDMERDVQAGRAAGCRTILLRLPSGQQAAQDALGEAESGEADFTVHSLREALDLIEQGGKTATVAPAPAAVPVPENDKPWLVAAEQVRAAPAAAAAAPTQPAEPTPPAPPPDVPPVASPAPTLVQAPVPEPAESRAPVQEPSQSRAPVQQPVEWRPPAQESNDWRPPVQEPPAEWRPPVQAAYLPPQRPQLPPPGSMSRLEQLTEQLLIELRRRHEQDHADFSVTKLLAGIVQVMALAAVFIGFMWGQDSISPYMLSAIFLEALTIALLMMGR
jgi:D-glycero-D-manno-heptose 1,7-bisphosphate phosphatase